MGVCIKGMEMSKNCDVCEFKNGCEYSADRFVNFLSLLDDRSVSGKDETICLKSMIRDFENEVIHGMDGET